MKKNSKLKILVLGGSGFVGKNIREKISKKYILLTPTHTELDLLDENTVNKFFENNVIDVVIFCVNLGGNRINPDFPHMFAQNLRMFFNVTRCSKYFKKMIFLGSGAEYDRRTNIAKIQEKDFDTSIPVDDYGYYKYLCSKYIESSDKIINLRIFGLFGKHEDYRIRFISNAICKTLFSLPITVNQNVFFDYVFINDFVQILEHFIDHDAKYKFYNIGTGQRIDLISLAEQINTIAQKKQNIIIKKSGLANEYTCANTRLIKELPDFSFTPLTESLGALYKYYAENKKLINKESLLKDY